MSTHTLEATSFVGRRRELSDIRGALASARLVTLVGVGGSGKTRLARRLQEESGDAFGAGSWLVELADLVEPALVGVAVADAMGLRAQPGELQAPRIAEFLGDAAGLLVLDNCEHLLDACAELAAALLGTCPGLRILVTSRQPLGIAGEHTYPVPPLSLPDLGSRRWQDLGGSESVSLFVGRAASALPDFRLGPGNAESVARLCVALEGLPLALELAAARIRVLSPEAMLDRLTDRYRLLSRGYADTPPRQQSLEASVGWSYDLCSPPEQLLWQRLSVFAGGFDLAAAEWVCAGNGLESEDILDLVGSLVEKSLLARDPREGQPHFRMLESIRQYGARRLAATGQTEHWQRRHREWFVDRAARFHEQWVGPHQPRLVAEARRNHPNIQLVLEHGLTDPAGATESLRTAVALEDYWLVTGQVSEARHWLEGALAHRTGGVLDRVRALSICAYFAGIQMELDYATDRIDEGAALLASSDTPDDTPSLAYLSFARSVLLLFRGDVAEAVEPSRRAVELFGASGSRHGVNLAQVVLGLCLSSAGCPEEAAEVKAEALRLADALGESHMRSFTLWSMALGAREANRPDEATQLARAALQQKSELEDELGTALVIEALASIASVTGDADRSATLLGVAAELWRRVGLSALAAPYIIAQRELGERIARGTLADKAFEAAYRRGQALDAQQAVDYALGLPLPGGPAPAPSPLTAREQQVADLIAEGLTNQEIANRLVISVRTAHGHVENILRKLGASSRTQVATWVVQRRAQAT